jgi:hypothetical protein
MRARALGIWIALCCGCGAPTPRDPTEGTIAFDPQRPDLPTATVTVAPYTGSDPLVLEAQARYVTGLDLHQKLIMRSCGGVNGVCHNQKEYPDLHTPGNFAAAIGAPCNVQPGSWSSVFDGCERMGDRFRIENTDFPDIEIGWLEQVRGTFVDYSAQGGAPPPDAAGLHLHLQAPLPGSRTEIWGRGLFIRTFVSEGQVYELPFISFESRWWVMADRTHLIADVPDYRQETVDAILKGGVVQGDMNRNGIFGYRAGQLVTLLNPGKPEESYLVGRLRGTLLGKIVPGSRMPLANQPPSIPDMLALMCFIEGLDPAQTPYNLANPIDYLKCSYSADPSQLNLVGQGVTFAGRIKPLLNANCGGCHGGQSPQAGLDLLSDGLYDRLMANSMQQPLKKLILPGSPENSYLWLKLSGDGSITGSRMPVDPVTGSRSLAPEELTDIESWIIAGALNN